MLILTKHLDPDRVSHQQMRLITIIIPMNSPKLASEVLSLPQSAHKEAEPPATLAACPRHRAPGESEEPWAWAAWQPSSCCYNASHTPCHSLLVAAQASLLPHIKELTRGGSQSQPQCSQLHCTLHLTTAEQEGACLAGGIAGGPKIQVWECGHPGMVIPQNAQQVPMTMTLKLSEGYGQMLCYLKKVKG